MVTVGRAAIDRRPVSPFAVWLLHMAIPLLGLWLLAAQPRFDVHWEHHQTHFWLVVGTAAINVALGLSISEQARRRSDARLFLVSLAFVSAAGFLGLHAIATPGVILEAKNTGFVVATPVGLFLASVFALLSSVNFSPAAADRVLRWQAPIRIGLLAGMVGWGVFSLTELPALNRELPPTEAHGPLVAVAAAGSLLYGIAAWRYYLVLRRRPAAILLSIITAFVLLAEAMIAGAYGRNWHASWWEWHVLMVLAFGFVAYSAREQYRREGSRSGLFNSIALEQTLENVRRDHTAALESLVDTMERGAATGPAVAALASRFGLTERQIEVLERGATALTHEREQIRRLGALVAVGREASVIRTQDDLLGRATALVQQAYGADRVRVAIVRSGRLVPLEGTHPADGGTSDGGASDGSGGDGHASDGRADDGGEGGAGVGGAGEGGAGEGGTRLDPARTDGVPGDGARPGGRQPPAGKSTVEGPVATSDGGRRRSGEARPAGAAAERNVTDGTVAGMADPGRLRSGVDLLPAPDGDPDAGAPMAPEGDARLPALRRRALAGLEPVESAEAGALILPLAVKGRGAGVLEVRSPPGGFAERDRSVLRSLASQLSIALENARLYQQLEGLFRSYMSPDVATALLVEPEQASLGGAVAEVTVLMADLEGFTPFAEKSPPGEVVSMLNAYYHEVVPCILDHGGTVVQFVGD
ncbi:MAG TPA: GAF domain-containing protein, partial [Mycobacteriales bacterium]|nr:GAF domain-containing protein [Mycobacteriales bacterium]